MPLPEAQQDPDAKEWMVIVEKQQREIEELRCVLASTATLHDGDSRSSHGSAFNSPLETPTPLSSEDHFASPRDGDDSLLGVEQYQKMCEMLQRMRSKLVKRDVTIRKARAQIMATRTEVGHYRSANSRLQVRVQELSMDLRRETAAKEEAIEKAAQALLQCDSLASAATNSKKAEQTVRAEFQVGQLRFVEMETSLHNLQLENAQLQLRIVQISGDKEDAEMQQQRLKSAMDSEPARVAECSALRDQNLAFGQQVGELESVVHMQTSQLKQQQHSLMVLEAERTRLELELQTQREESKRHAIHLLQTNISLQQHAESVSKQGQVHKRNATECEERNQMVSEELDLMRLKENHRQIQLQRYEEDYRVLFSSYKDLVRASSAMDLSRRDLISALRQSKKKLFVLQGALETLDAEIQNISKVATANRTREQSVGRALREYSKRNRALQDAVGATKHQVKQPLRLLDCVETQGTIPDLDRLCLQLRNVLESLRSSEKRKTRAVAEASILKRDLVLEKCQRSDLLRQCKELEKCLAFCHTSASKTHEHTHLLQQENSVLQDAVKQLCAYSHELVASQQALQQELTQLEVAGKAEPLVFG